jgi:hypothetical protein
MASGNKETQPNAGASGDNATEVLEAEDVGRLDTFGLPVKYVLYSHISYREQEDLSLFKEWERQSAVQGGPGARATSTIPVPSEPNFKIVDDLKPFMAQLGSLLTDADTPGMLILFYATGYAECLEDIAEKRYPTRDDAVKGHPELGCADAVQRDLQSLFDNSGVRLRVRVITALDLYDMFSRIETDYAQNLIQWFIGLQEEKVRYDAPKIVEAITRVRMIGSGAPVFRIDQDVLFRKPFGDDPGNATEESLGLGEPIQTCVKAFRERVEDPRMAAFLFSGSYESQPLKNPGQCREFGAWSRAFATRCFPALCILPGPLREARRSQREASDKGKEAKRAREAGVPDADKKAKEADEAEQRASEMWKTYVDKAVESDLMCQFFGIKQDRDRLGCILADPDEAVGIGWLGAHPLVSVISGALLCINDSAILDLPPFSNFNLNVSWIDDHLKYCLHRELRHFTTTSIIRGSPLILDARIDSVKVVKGREPIKNLPEYLMGNYLPTVLYGCVVDAWITPGPNEGRRPRTDEKLPCLYEDYKRRDDRIIKWRPEMLDPRRKKEWNAIPQSGLSRGLLPHKLQTVLGRGAPMSPLERRRFRHDLLDTALRRITAVRNAWSKLIRQSGPTFAYVWAFGESIGDVHLPGMTGKGKGLVRAGVELDVELKLGDLNENVREDLIMLVEDAVTYIDMTLNWSKTIQLIRSIEPGTLKTDLFWKPED